MIEFKVFEYYVKGLYNTEDLNEFEMEDLYRDFFEVNLSPTDNPISLDEFLISQNVQRKILLNDIEKQELYKVLTKIRKSFILKNSTNVEALKLTINNYITKYFKSVKLDQ